MKHCYLIPFLNGLIFKTYRCSVWFFFLHEELRQFISRVLALLYFILFFVCGCILKNWLKLLRNKRLCSELSQ